MRNLCIGISIILSVILIKWIVMTGLFFWTRVSSETEFSRVDHPVFKHFK
jgi:hypothetical protein